MKQDETPIATPALTAEELLAISKLNESDLSAIHETILSNCSERWLKIALVVAKTERDLSLRFPGLSFVFYSQCVNKLVSDGLLELQGDPSFIRFSEIRKAERH